MIFLTCPNCGSIVMKGDPYCSHCGAHFQWEDSDDEYENRLEYDYDEPDYSYVPKTDYNEPDDSHTPESEEKFLDFGEVSKTYVDAGENELDYIADCVCENSSQKLQLKAVIRQYQNALDFSGFHIRKDWEFEVYYFHFIQQNEYVKTTHVMTFVPDSNHYSPYHAFYESYSKHNHDGLIANPLFKRLVEGVDLEFVGCGGGYNLRLESVSDVKLTGDIGIRVYFKADGKKKSI